jgi:hypothetical protein
MRSSKSRSRSKQNRNRSVGNIINRVFDSSGPEGKVRGTPQQIIDKYNQLARDAQLGNDRVAAENFQQHSEHYTRMLGEAMREIEAQRQSQDGNFGGGGNSQQNRGNDYRPREEREERPPREEREEVRAEQPQPQPQQSQPQPSRRAEPAPAPAMTYDQPEVGPEAFAFDLPDDADAAGDSGLVETPESAAPKPRSGRSRRPRPERSGPAETNPSEAAQ